MIKSSLLISVLFCLVTSAAAQEPSSNAHEKFTNGIASFDKKDFADALDSFEQAYALNPSWKLLYNIGQCQAALKKYGLAVTSFEKYLATGGDEIDDARRDEVLGELEKMRLMIGDLEITAKDGLDVYVDDTLRGATPLPGSISVTAGVVHKVDLRRDDIVVYSSNKSVRGGTTSKVVFVEKSETDQVEVVVSAPPVPPEKKIPDTVQASPQNAPVKDSGRKKISPVPFWIFAGTTVALGGTTIAMAAYVGANNDNVKSSAEADKLNTMRTVGLVTLFSSIATAVTAGVLAGFTDFKGRRKTAAVPLTVYAARNQAGVIFSGSF